MEGKGSEKRKPHDSTHAKLSLESAQLIETSYAMSSDLGGEFLWWMLLGVVEA